MDRAERLTDKLIVREVEGETVVYNTATEMVTVLDAETAAVWQAADGQAPIEGMVETLELSQERVEVALVRLGDAGLLKAPMSRRTLLRGAGAAVAAGGLLTVMAPPAFAAASGTRTISATGSCPANASTTAKDATVTVTVDGFTAGTVNYTINYPTGAAGATTTATITGTVTQPLTTSGTSGPVKLTSYRVGGPAGTITATDASGKTGSGSVTVTRC